MNHRHQVLRFSRTNLHFYFFVAFFVTVLVAGGSSRADVFGQFIVRCAASATAIVLILFGSRPRLNSFKPVAYLLSATVVLVSLQLIPLPPLLWHILPGRGSIAGVSQLIGQHNSWRPLSMSPGGTWNSLASLVVPIVTIALTAGLKGRERRWIIPLFLSGATLSALTGLIQFSGSPFDNPFVNDQAGSVSGTFANRNHFALLMAIGCPASAAWTFYRPRPSILRLTCGIILGMMFLLMILASGSRAGIILAVFALLLSGALVLRDLNLSNRQRMSGLNVRWIWGLFTAIMIAAIAVLGLIAFWSDRAVSIDRYVSMGVVKDLRSLALPTITHMVDLYTPWGSGFGTFDKVYRIHEAKALLAPEYFNHAHNDFLEVVIEGGVAGAALVFLSISGWTWFSVRVWVSKSGNKEAKLGSIILLLAFLASAVDYPVRTPLMMFVVTIAALWLCETPDRSDGSTARDALPRLGEHL